MPNDWSWHHSFELTSERLARITEQCNGYAITVETPLTDFIKIIFIVCIRKCPMDNDEDGCIYTVHERAAVRLKYCEFLSLPITVYHQHPLYFALAHAEHGKRVATGFPEGDTSLGDMDESRNNLLVETRSSNHAKWEFF
jgi:hypothetical protein